MKLAFVISTNKDARHLRDLVDSLPKESDFYIHVDEKRDLSHFENIIDSKNVTFLRDRLNIVAGSISEVECQVELLRKALEGGTYDYIVYLSGLDYPVWSNERIEECFAKAGGKEILSGIAMVGQGRAAYPYTDFHPFANHSWRSGSLKDKARGAARKLLNLSSIHKTLSIHCAEKTYILYKGASSWAITPGLAKLIVKEWDENKRLHEYFRTSYRPIETFIPTVALNSDYAANCTIIKGHYKGIDSLSTLTYIDGGNEPKVLTEVDYADITAEGKMFCRKVVTGYSDGLKSLIDAARNTK